MLDHGVLHAGDLHVDAEGGLAYDHVGIVHADHFLADVTPLTRILERDVLGTRNLQCGSGLDQLAVIGGLARRQVNALVVLRLTLGSRHVPIDRRGLVEHRASGRAELAHALEVVAHAARTVRVLVAVHLVAHRLFDLDAAPVGFQFIGEDHRHAGAHALTHFRAVRDDGHGAALVDGNEHVRAQRSRSRGHALGGVGHAQSRERAGLGDREHFQADNQPPGRGGSFD